MSWLAGLHRLGSILIGAGVLTLVRSNVLAALVMFLMANSGAWKYFANALEAYDAQQVAAWSSPRLPARLPVVVAIDDQAYQTYFQARSPMSRERLHALLEVVAAHTSFAAPVVLDVDVSPVPEDRAAQRRLDQLFLQQPGKWVLPAVAAGGTAQDVAARQWREALCRQGVRFGLPYLHTEFGYPRLTRQYRDSLADVVLSPVARCADADAPRQLQDAPVHAAYLRQGTVLPFSGDLEALAQALDAVQPDLVFVGGAWGHTDVVGTPFGDRYGVHVHAALAAGQLAGERVAPPLMNLGLAWLFLALMTVLLHQAVGAMKKGQALAAPSMVGHLFFSTRGRPLLFCLIVLAGLWLALQLCSAWHGVSGQWINQAQICATTLVYLVVVWNLGRGEPDLFGGWRATWQRVVVLPVGNDVRALRQCLAILSGRQAGWREGQQLVPLSRTRVAFEGFWAGFSLLLQTGLPLVSTAYLLRAVLAG